jgi:hypothetical protein
MNSTPPLVPAFESSLGTGDPSSPVLVNSDALAEMNQQLATTQKAVLRYGPEAGQVAALFAKRAIRPDEIAALRRQMFTLVSSSLKDVEEVLSGKKHWTPSQTRLFALLTERVMPKLANIVVEDNTSKKLDEMSIDELEAIALGKKKADAVDAVMHEAAVLDELAEKVERKEAKKEVVRQLAHIDALDQAEKNYIARRVSTPMAVIEKESDPSRKFQPKPTPEQLEKTRAHTSKRKSYNEYLAEKGFTPEEVEAKVQERNEKIRQSKLRWTKVQQERAARTLGLGEAASVAIDIDKLRKKTMKEFRVHPLKGTRSQTALTKRAAERKEKAEKFKEREENPRIYISPERLGIDPEKDLHGEKLRLRRLRELKPEAFGDEVKTDE